MKISYIFISKHMFPSLVLSISLELYCTFPSILNHPNVVFLKLSLITSFCGDLMT